VTESPWQATAIAAAAVYRREMPTYPPWDELTPKCQAAWRWAVREACLSWLDEVGLLDALRTSPKKQKRKKKG
jgi:hypothetical protein